MNEPAKERWIENEPDDPRASRCGHGFAFSLCPYRYCSGRDRFVARPALPDGYGFDIPRAAP